MPKIVSKSRLNKAKHMKKFTSLFIFLMIACASLAQVPTYFNTSAAGGANSFPLSNTGTSRKVQWFIPPGSLGAVPPGNNITDVYFQAGSAASINYPILTVKLKTAAPGATGLSGVGAGPVEPSMQTVYSGVNVQVVTTLGGWIKITLQTPFLYNQTQGLIVELEHNSTSFGGPTLYQAGTNPGPGPGRQWADYNVGTLSGVGGLERVNFGIDVLPSTPCTVTPGPNSIVTPSYAICPNSSANLSLATTYSFGGITYQWQSSTSSSGPFTAVSGGTSNVLTTPNLTIATYYNALITCTNVTGTITASVGQVSVSPVTTLSIPYYEGFEGIQGNNDLPNCSWTKSSGNAQTYAIPQNQNRIPRTGTKFASFYYTPAGTHYFYTNGLALIAGITYSASMWYTTEYYGYQTYSLSILVGTTQSPAGLVTIANTNNAASPNYKQLANTFSVATTGLYYVAIRAISNGVCCANYLTWDDLSITIPCELNPVPATINANFSTICDGQSVNLTASAGPDVTFMWNTGVSTTTITDMPNFNNSYSVVFTNTVTNCIANVTKNIVVNPSPLVFVTPSSDEICAGDALILSTSGSASSYTWNTGVNTSIITVTPAITSGMASYSVTGSNIYNCKTTAVQQVNVNPLPIVTASSSVANSCPGQVVTFVGTGATSYQWAANTAYVQGNPVTITMPTTSTTYTMTGTDDKGCSSKVTYVQQVSNCTAIESQKANIEGLSVYPNPTTGLFSVELANGLGKTIEITDVSGRIISTVTSTENTVDFTVQNLANGIYYVTIKSNDGKEVMKLVKQ